jgi:hypothetical protein
MSDDLIKLIKRDDALQQEETKLKKEKVATLRKAAAFMQRVHQQSCFEQGNHSYEVDTYYGLACEALRFQARIILAALEPQPIDPAAIREAALREAAIKIQEQVNDLKDQDRELAFNLAIYGRDVVLALIGETK